MSQQEEEVDRGGFRTAGAAVGFLGLLGMVIGFVLALTDVGDPRIVEVQGMVVTGLLQCVVGSVMWWWGARP
ncbi:MAG: hypothetical protein VX265_06870 [Myxococcota bacterium]|nr:hypothetical protein [Myxococcota bacterium]